MSVRSVVTALAFSLVSSPVALAGKVNFDPAHASGSQDPISFDVSIAQSDMPEFDSVALVFTFPEKVRAEFAYGETFLNSVTLPPPVVAPFCGSGYCHLLIGGNRFSPPLWSAPLLIGMLTVDVSAVEPAAFPLEILTSASAETEILGTPLSMLAVNGWTLEQLEGSATITLSPEPAALALLALGSIAMMRRRR